MSNFSKELALAAESLQNNFPINFDAVWVQLGYTCKWTGVRFLKSKFCEGSDFICTEYNDILTMYKAPVVAGKPYSIWLSTNCFSKLRAMKEGKKVTERKEKLIQKKIHAQLGGKCEVITPAGKIDLLTKTELIEIKEAKNWKDALGKVIAYGCYYPSHNKVTYLFGACHWDFQQIVQDVCSKNNVKVVWMDDENE